MTVDLRDIAERIVRDAMPATDSGHTCFVPRYQIDQLAAAIASAPAPTDSGERGDGLPVAHRIIRGDLVTAWISGSVESSDEQKLNDAGFTIEYAYAKQCRSADQATIARLTAELETLCNVIDGHECHVAVEAQAAQARAAIAGAKP